MRWSKSLGYQGFGLVFAVLTVASMGASDQTLRPVYKKKYVMGTVFEIVAYDTSPAHASDAIDKAWDEIVHLDHLMSNYQPDSDLSRLNRSAYRRTQTVSLDLYQVIREALRYSDLSGGKFDVTVGPLADRWKAVGSGEPAPSPTEEEELRRCVGYRKIELIPPNAIRFHSSCLKLDLGAIGKGYAVDRAATVLRSQGIECALINAGGSTIYGIGSPPGQRAWLVHLRDPSTHLNPRLMLRENSVSTSEQTPASLLGESRFGHIIDPGKGVPLNATFAVSAVAETATASDALSTSLLLLGPEEGGALVKKLPNVAAVWVWPDGRSEMASTGPMISLRDSGDDDHEQH
jgi:FAD:protein FMN transferase